MGGAGHHSVGADERLRHGRCCPAALSRGLSAAGESTPPSLASLGLARTVGRENMEEAARHSLRWRCSVRTSAHTVSIRLSQPDLVLAVPELDVQPLAGGRRRRIWTGEARPAPCYGARCPERLTCCLTLSGHRLTSEASISQK